MARRSHQAVRKGTILLGLALLAFLFFTKATPLGRNRQEISPFDASLQKHAEVNQDVASESSPPPALDESIDVYDEHDSTSLPERGLIGSIQLLRLYTQLQKKGAKLICLLYGTEPTATQWTDYSDLASWGWEVERSNNANFHCVAEACSGVDVGDLMNGIRMGWSHAQATSHMVNNPKGGSVMTKYDATNALYNNVHWPADGVLVSVMNYGPSWTVGNHQGSVDPWKGTNGKALPLPQLGQWSDVVFLTWKYLTTPQQRANLRWVFRREIENDDTNNIIGYVAKKRNVGKARPSDDNDGPVWALLATPNLRGVAWLLAQHKADMGERTVRSIRVWNGGSEGDDYTPSMLLEIGPLDGGDQ
ncbi:hypothetical protein LTR36_002760 [Oleoguttula mirabilis]|uniref:Uncharacterized protein n=1 Tax=Oleoguttula mirabilis TaxID=1507867 RepID=A0AAV9JJG9_9PEZI|nr:hypothetical protein LTR36_002760 [Oleoguttula mirabilis]